MIGCLEREWLSGERIVDERYGSRPGFARAVTNLWAAARATALAFAVVACRAAMAAAQGAPATRDTVEQWLTQNASAKPDFKPGDVLTAKDLERLRLLIPPVYIDQLNFPQLKMEIVAARSHMPRKDFAARDCRKEGTAQT